MGRITNSGGSGLRGPFGSPKLPRAGGAGVFLVANTLFGASTGH